jgi:hypothetical protein
MTKKKCEKCGFEISSCVFMKHFSSCDGKGPKRMRKIGVCPHCLDVFPPRSVGAHTVFCVQNPKVPETKRTLSKSLKGKTLSEKTKQRISQNIQKRIETGTWHLSFSHARTHLYNGVKLHGMWEVKYAKHLAANSIAWRRPTEKFAYEFAGKQRYYTPDFYLYSEGVYVEIKGYQTPKDEAKWRDFPLPLRVLKGEDLIKLGVLTDSEVRS